MKKRRSLKRENYFLPFLFAAITAIVLGMLVIFYQVELSKQGACGYKLFSTAKSFLLQPSGITSSTPQVEQPEISVAPPQTAPVVSANPPSALGSAAISPDGAWEVEVVETGDCLSSCEHELVLKNLIIGGQPDRVLLTKKETATSDKENPGTHAWFAAGWSADGKSVFYASKQLFGYKTDVAPAVTYGSRLYEVNIDSKSAKQVFKVDLTGDVMQYGILDFDALNSRVVYWNKGGIVVSTLDNKRIFSKPMLGIKSAMFGFAESNQLEIKYASGSEEIVKIE